MVSAPFWRPLDAGNAPRSGRTCCGSNRKNAAKGGEIARRACCPEWGQTFRKESFQSGEAAKDLILFVRSRHCGELNRGLQNLDSFFEKGFNFVSAKLWFCALIRGLQNLEAPFGKGFNFVSAKPQLRRADLRFAEPRISRKGNGLSLFASCKK